MANYYVELSGQFTLDQQSKAIEGEEARGAKFVGSQIWTNAINKISNLVEFEELNTAPITSLGIPILSKALPDGATPTWVGPMIVLDSVAKVYLLRA